VGGIVCYFSAVGLFFGDGGACIVAITSAYVSFAGVCLVALSAIVFLVASSVGVILVVYSAT
jgi:hypothetical protein